MTIDAMIDGKPITDFLEAARNFCAFIEKEEVFDPIDFLKRAENHLLILYTLARGIPTVDLESDEDVDFTVDEKEMKSILALIGKKTPLSYYWAVLIPVDIVDPPETGTGDLIDDLGDIYKELKEALNLIEKPMLRRIIHTGLLERIKHQSFLWNENSCIFFVFLPTKLPYGTSCKDVWWVENGIFWLLFVP